jgi:cell division protein FtsW
VSATQERAGGATRSVRAPRSSAPSRPTTTGTSGRLLDRPLTSYHLIVGCSALLLALGLVMVLSASSVESFKLTGSSTSIFQKQAVWAVVGVPAMWAVSRTPVRILRMMAIPLLLGSIALLCLVLVPGIGRSVNGNQNWIDFGGPFRIQPSEAAKLAIVVWGADLLARKEKLLTQWRHLLVPLVPVSGLLVALVMAGGDLGTTVILLVIVASLLFVVGAPARLFVLLGGAVVLGIALLSVTSAHRLSRFKTMLNPDAAYLGAGWQAMHARFALGSGGWWGLGLGGSRQKWGDLPEAHTDFIFAVIGEELGLMGTGAVLALFGLVIYAGIRIALRSQDLFSRLCASGLTAWIAVQALINIGAVLGLLPIAGVPLPLVSYGGSALLPMLVALGLLLAFARNEPGAAAALAARKVGPVGRMAGRLRRRPA